MDQIQQNAALFWPLEIVDEANRQSILQQLLDTQDDFISILNYPAKSVEAFFAAVENASLSSRLFLKHSMVITDFGGELLQRVNSFFDLIFPGGVLEFSFRGVVETYRFETLPVSGLTNQRLKITGNRIPEEEGLDPMVKDVIAILVFGGASTHRQAANILQNCDLHEYLGRKRELAEYVRQKYIWVSRIIAGAVNVTRGNLIERSIEVHLRNRLEPHGIMLSRNSYLPGVTHRGQNRNSTTNETTFDLVARKGERYVGIEISFQVTTNSVIERKGREALETFRQAEVLGYGVAHIIDGAGNFQRRPAFTNLLEASHCTVAYSEEELDLLSDFIIDYILNSRDEQ